jgi:hypothetical protein
VWWTRLRNGVALTEEDNKRLKKLRALVSSEVPKKLRELRDSSRSIKTLLAVRKELEANVRKKLEAVRATRLMSQVESKLRDAAELVGLGVFYIL